MKLKLVEKINQLTVKKILEIGAGTGDFLVACQNARWDCYGVEPSEIARTVAQDVNNLSLFKEVSEIGERDFSVITLWHVLEHIPDLDYTIVKLKSLLAESGSLIIAVPNHNSFDAKHYKHFWAAYDVPRHLYHFNNQSLTLIMESKGFKLAIIKPMIFDSFYVSLLSEKYMRNSFIINILKGIFVGIFSNISALITGESSSLIFVFKKSGR